MRKKSTTCLLIYFTLIGLTLPCAIFAQRNPLRDDYTDNKYGALEDALEEYSKDLNKLQRNYMRREDLDSAIIIYEEKKLAYQHLAKGEYLIHMQPENTSLEDLNQAWDTYFKLCGTKLAKVRADYRKLLTTHQKNLMNMRPEPEVSRQLRYIATELAFLKTENDPPVKTSEKEEKKEKKTKGKQNNTTDYFSESIEHKGRHYKIFKESISWHDAQKKCEDMGGNLCTISDNDENNFIIKIANLDNEDLLWLGANDETADGSWAWIDDTDFEFTSWRAGEPKDYDYGNQFLTIDRTGRWFGKNDSSKLVIGYICEWEFIGDPNIIEGDIPGGSHLSSDILNALAIVEGDSGVGSAFICNMQGRYFAVTNLHVIAGHQQFSIKTMNGERLVGDKIYGAKGYDLAIISLPNFRPRYRLVPVHHFEEDATVNTDIIVPGNKLGGSVVTETVGKIKNRGSKLIEVDAKFASGNSGSPIILKNDPIRVVGIATLVSKHKLSDLEQIVESGELKKEKKKKKESQKEKKYRYYGYRIDNVKDSDWEEIDWKKFVKQGQQIKAIEELTQSLITLMTSSGSFYNYDDRIGYIDQSLKEQIFKTNLARQLYIDAFKSYQTRLTYLAKNDIEEMSKSHIYDYFNKELKQQKKIRAKILDRLPDLIDSIRKKYKVY